LASGNFANWLWRLMPPFEIVCRMAGKNMRMARNAKGISLEQLAEDVGLSVSQVSRFETGQREPRLGEARRIAARLGLPLEQFGDDDPSPHLSDADMDYERGDAKGLEIRGHVAAGAWFEIDSHADNGHLEFAPVVPSPEYPARAQYALRVKGDSINKIALEGDLLRCLDLGITGLEPRDGDLVIVEQSRDDGQLREVTAKRVTRSNGHIQLVPESTNPRWQPIIYDQAQDDGAVEVRIIAIVDAVIRPVFRGRG